MRKYGLLFCALCLASGLAWAQGQGMSKVFVKTTVKNADSLTEVQRGDATAIAHYLESRLAELMAKNYPCMTVLTQQDLVALLDSEKERRLLSDDDLGRLEALGGALGVNYLLSVSVMAAGPGQYYVNGMMIDVWGKSVEGRSGTSVPSGDPSLPGAEAYAQQLVSSLASLKQFSPEKCTPTNLWMGTITFSRGKEKTDRFEPGPLMHATRVYDKGEGTDQTSERSKVEFRIPWAGPVKVTVDYHLTQRKEVTRTFRASCKVPGNWQERTTANGTKSSVENDESTGAGAVNGNAIISLNEGKIVFQLSAEDVEGTFTHHSTSKTSGGCPDEKPENLDVSSNSSAKLGGMSPLTFEAPANPNAKVQSGTNTTFGGGTLSWMLKRTPLKQ